MHDVQQVHTAQVHCWETAQRHFNAVQSSHAEVCSQPSSASLQCTHTAVAESKLKLAWM